MGDAFSERPDTFKNYKSVEEGLGEAEIELECHEGLNYLKRNSMEEAERLYPGGTAAGLG